MTGAAALAARFRRFAARECAGVSPLYEALGRAIAEDDRLLALAAGARPGQPATSCRGSRQPCRGTARFASTTPSP